MYTMYHHIMIGTYRLMLIDSVEIKRSVDILADVAEIKVPDAQGNKVLDVERKIQRGDRVVIQLGYKESGLVEEFRGYLQSVSTDGGDIKLVCEDDLYTLRKGLPNGTLKKVKLSSLLQHALTAVGSKLKMKCSYDWTYDKFTFQDATVYDVLKKVQEECGADVYIQDETLHVHPPGEVVGEERYYDFTRNVEESGLSYKRAEDKKVQVVVKSTMPDGTVKEVTVGATGGDKVEVKCTSSDEATMKQRGEVELRRRSFDGYEGDITTWLVPYCQPGDSAKLRDVDYPQKDGVYYVKAVTTTFSSSGGKRKVELGWRLS